MLNFFGTEFELRISKIVGEPIATKNLAVKRILDAIANIDSAPAGDLVYEVQGIDPDVDTVLDTDSEGNVTLVKKTQVGTAVVTFKELESPLYYRKLGDLLNNFDTKAIARANDSIARGLDKREVKIVLKAITDSAKTSPTQDATHKEIKKVVAASSDDLYDVLDEALRTVEDYGDAFAWLCGTEAYKAIGRYGKAKASNFNYKIDLIGDMQKLGALDPIKVSGQVKLTTTGSPQKLLDPNYVIFVATAGGDKPIDFIRRKIDPAIAKLTGGNVDTMQRLTLVKNLITGDSKSTVGLFGWESIAAVIKNPLKIVVVDLSAIL